MSPLEKDRLLGFGGIKQHHPQMGGGGKLTEAAEGLRDQGATDGGSQSSPKRGGDLAAGAS
eukprot:12838978-Alexandrium_andersonii.AAC.1